MAKPGWQVRRAQQRRAVLDALVGAVGLAVAVVAFYLIAWLAR